ncbi:hypothetical protein OG558_19375 [Kribbella sp. NBC_01510]|uniref:hypothetical protein n=1 Tax=Kribbella sp. NBC_01510 TaxID=2903581 RepID=UPI00386F036B
MSTSNGMRPETPETPDHESWWSRIGTLGQALTALTGLIVTVVPILVATGLPGQDSGNSNFSPTVVPTTSQPYTSPPSTTPPPQAEGINLTVSDQLTDGAEEEVIVITLEGSRVATLHATREQPVVSQRVTATRAGNYSYVVDAVMRWYDETGTEQVTNATGRGSVSIDDGTRLDVYVHEETDGISLSLESATQ